MIRNQNVCDSNRIQVMQRRIQVLTGALNQLTIQQRRGECQGVVYRNRCYFLLDDGCEPNMLTHQGAQAACGAQQGHLVRIINDMQYNFLFNYVLRNAYDFMAENREFVLVWTDARWDFQHGVLRFSNNETTSYKTWNLGHPINMTERSHVAMAVASRPILRGMIDVPPTTQFYPLCEKTMRCRYGKRSH
uniref:C-type lectin domain-containing protein n=1 Tax=Ciona savignyi TaxID=51511 RepID=H2ZG83_CIOSA